MVNTHLDLLFGLHDVGPEEKLHHEEEDEENDE
jgi:hypothetical protein